MDFSWIIHHRWAKFQAGFRHHALERLHRHGFFCITSAFDELMMENFNNKSIGKALEFSICEHLKLQ